MKTEWNYTDLAEAYLKRPEYSKSAIDELLTKTSVNENSKACDVGAGVAHLTLELVKRQINVIAVEPNDAMRALGSKRTSNYTNIQWIEGVGEDTGLGGGEFDLVTFGSSFNVTNRSKALIECKRLLKSNGWFAAMWNHRNLDDPIQSEIENIIRKAIPDYGYGSRREDQTKVINESGLFKPVHVFEGGIVHEQSIEDIVSAWRSHATLHRQAGTKFEQIISEIERMLESTKKSEIPVPYTTRVWCAQVI